MYETQLQVEHYPNLSTVLMVENVLQKTKKSLVTVAGLKKMLPRQVNHNTLMIILHYLEESNKIAVSLRGISWIHNTNPNLRSAIARGLDL